MKGTQDCERTDGLPEAGAGAKRSNGSIGEVDRASGDIGCVRVPRVRGRERCVGVYVVEKVVARVELSTVALRRTRWAGRRRVAVDRELRGEVEHEAHRGEREAFERANGGS